MLIKYLALYDDGLLRIIFSAPYSYAQSASNKETREIDLINSEFPQNKSFLKKKIISTGTADINDKQLPIKLNIITNKWWQGNKYPKQIEQLIKMKITEKYIEWTSCPENIIANINQYQR
jgi:hypothetical protein